MSHLLSACAAFVVFICELSLGAFQAFLAKPSIPLMSWIFCYVQTAHDPQIKGLYYITSFVWLILFALIIA